MESGMMIFVGIILAVPMIMFLWQLKRIGWARTTREFFLADRKVDNGEFIDTTVAYGYQVAALSLFAIWGFEYGFWTIWVSVFWFLGFQILRVLNDRKYLDKYVLDESVLSIHGFLAKRYRTRRLAQLAAFASMLGLSGTAFFEAEFTSSIVISGIARGQNESLLLFLVFVLIALIYIVVGGFRAVVETDRIQLSLGFVAFSLFSVITYNRVIGNGYAYTGLVLYGLSLVCVLLLNLMFGMLNKVNSIVFPKKYNLTLAIGLAIYIMGGFFILWGVMNTEGIRDSMGLFLRDQKVGKVFSLGILPLVSLLLANGLWQLVDISNWQRLASLKYSGEYRRELSKTLTFVSIYSPITWIIAIFFGMSLRYIGFNLESAWTSFQDMASAAFASRLIFDRVYILILIFSMVSIMYSTLDSLISSISYTCYCDIILKGNLEEKAELSKARVWTIVYTGVFLVIYIIVRRYASRVDDILYTFYAFQLALFPTIMWALVSRKVNKASAFFSILGGSILCIVTLWVNSKDINPYSAAATFSVVGSTLIYWALTPLKRYEVMNE